MRTNNMVLVGATKLVKQAAQNKSVKTATVMLVDVVVKPVTDAITAGGTAALTRRLANRKNHHLADQLARQVGGTYDRAIISGDRYWVVWQDETPFEVYPPLPEGIGPLPECRELQNYQGDRAHPTPRRESRRRRR